MPRIAAEPLVDRCRRTRLILGQMTASVSAYTRNTHPLGLNMLLVEFMLSFEQLSEVRPNLHDVQECWRKALTPETRALSEEHLLCISAINDLLAALLPKLDRQVWVDAGSHEDLGFKALWRALFQACTMFGSFPFDWPIHLLPIGHPVCATVHSVMLYLLPLACPGSSSNTPWAPPLGQPVSCSEIRVMIMPALCVMYNICNASGPRLTAAVRSLDPAFVKTLCILACEKLDASLPQDMVGHFFFKVTGTITTCVTAAVEANSERDIAPFRSLAVLDAAERGLAIMRGRRIPMPLLEQVRDTLRVLGA